MNKNNPQRISAIHSSAFNCSSFLDSGVDPRTGLYTTIVSLSDIGPIQCPEFRWPLSLMFNSLQNQDKGLGVGWSLRLSSYDPEKYRLTLSSGETFRALDSGHHLDILDQKVKNFLVEKTGNHLLIKYKSGMLEKLTQFKAGIYVPTEVITPEGHSLKLRYMDFQGHPLLKDVRDDVQTLLKTEKSEQQVKITLHPDTSKESIYSLVLKNHCTVAIRLPVDNLASWRYQYRYMGGMLFITRVDTPMGGAEIIQYQEQGHTLPAYAPMPHMPYVVSIISTPRSGQPETTTTYRYTTKNFLGYDAPHLVWNDYQDNLHKVAGEYEYGMVETLMRHHQDGDRAVRTISRVYNRYHVLLSEVTNQNGKVCRKKYEYPILPGLPYKNQPSQCLLPRREIVSYYLSFDTSNRHEEVTETDYDEFGNILRRLSPCGVEEVKSYYGLEGEPGCPPDPLGFVRWVKESTVTPAPVTHVALAAPVMQTRYRYMEFPPVHEGYPNFLRLVHESLWETGIGHDVIRVNKEMEYWDDPANAGMHGRLVALSETLNHLTTTHRYRYIVHAHELAISELAVRELPVRESAIRELAIRESIVGYDGRRRELLEHRCQLTGRLVRMQDDEDVCMEFEYDKLGRVIRETTAGGTEYEASRIYRYRLTTCDTDQAELLTIDATGVQTRTLFDGLNRILRIESQDVNQADGVIRTIYEASYNELGQLVEETCIDWMDGDALVLTSSYEYDDWGKRCSVLRPDGVKERLEWDPVLCMETSWEETVSGEAAGEVNNPEENIQESCHQEDSAQAAYAQQERPEASWSVNCSANSSVNCSAKKVTIKNLFDQPIVVDYLGAQERSLGRTLYVYDGYGRCISRTDASLQITTYEYDYADRLVTTILPDDTDIVYCYSPHSRRDLVTEVRINDLCIGRQEFDGLDRLVKRKVGGRKTTFDYEGGMSRPMREQTPSGKSIEYRYDPRLTRKYTDRLIPGEREIRKNQYEFHPVSGQLIRSLDVSTESEHLLDYFPSGMLRREIWMQGGLMEEAAYRYSMQGLLTEYKDPLRKLQRNYYDECGRLERIEYEHAQAVFSYNGFGKLSQCDLHDLHHNVFITTMLEYDELGREWSRSITCPGRDTYVMTQSYTSEGKIARRLTMQGGALMRDESYEYDARGRLQYYYCDGENPRRNRDGAGIRAQAIDYDSLDNIIKLVNRTDEGESVLIFKYDNLLDPTQLTGISGPHHYRQIDFTYDGDGNLIRSILNGHAQSMHYDPLGRLAEIGSDAEGINRHFRYNAFDQLEAVEPSGSPHIRQRYQGNQPVCEIQGTVQNRYFITKQQIWGAQDHYGESVMSLFGFDQQKNMLLMVSGDKVVDMPGDSTTHLPLNTIPVGAPGCLGEILNQTTEYDFPVHDSRAYSSEMMRYFSPDSSRPFCPGGKNPYACYFGDPVSQSGSQRQTPDEILATRQPGGGEGVKVVQCLVDALRRPTGGFLHLLGIDSQGVSKRDDQAPKQEYLGQAIFRELVPLLDRYDIGHDRG
ncbi:hypothetical protein BTA51_06655 [Hahella sp. CCB-MM4]|uniref:RHS repeat protein n=1 Tax=Hahella sp. (strain CCB-MM4) TaxID=1926491 RepID=UPI000B9C000E|nr:RHS repeat protein [Hahella sp. CCB-MM4]OZG74661.1 hypothetical protein BTA51_06655 [Hahella sp. CCB-MM4]